jgi:flagellar biosynthesis/type III secretory pathway protein FliH
LSSAIENEIRDRSIQMPTIVEQRYLEGIQQGIQQGKQQGIQEGKTAGLAEGLQQGRTQGQWIGQIQTLQELLGRPVSPSEELAARSVAELTELAAVLKAALRGNGKD